MTFTTLPPSTEISNVASTDDKSCSDITLVVATAAVFEVATKLRSSILDKVSASPLESSVTVNVPSLLVVIV